jgi:hypothetical protein
VQLQHLLSAVSVGLRGSQARMLLRQASCPLQAADVEGALAGRVLGYRPLDTLCQLVCEQMVRAAAVQVQAVQVAEPAVQEAVAVA